jgi:hypothetical protein
MKLDAWKYEAEYRILAAQVDQIEYDENSLIEVAFGCRMNPDFEPVIRKWVTEGAHRRVKFLKVKLSKRPEGYEYEEI